MNNDADQVRRIRRFNRFYTNVLGLLDRAVHHSSYSLLENRLLFEVHEQGSILLSDLKRVLNLDAGYLSRVVSKLEKAGLLTRTRRPGDGRKQEIRLTELGVLAKEMLDGRADDEVRNLVGHLSVKERDELVASLELVHRLLSGDEHEHGVRIRPPVVGEFGWILQEAALILSDLRGWDARAETFVASLIAETLGASRMSASIAEVHGVSAGAVISSRTDDAVEVQLLFVTPAAQRQGVGSALLEVPVRLAESNAVPAVDIWVPDAEHLEKWLSASEFVRTPNVRLPQRTGEPQARRRWTRSVGQG